MTNPMTYAEMLGRLMTIQDRIQAYLPTGLSNTLYEVIQALRVRVEAEPPSNCPYCHSTKLVYNESYKCLQCYQDCKPKDKDHA